MVISSRCVNALFIQKLEELSYSEHVLLQVESEMALPAEDKEVSNNKNLATETLEDDLKILIRI